MRKKNQNFGVELVVVENQTQVLIDKKQIGYVAPADRGFVGYFGQQAVMNMIRVCT